MGIYAFGRDVKLGFIKETGYNEAWGAPALTGIYINPDVDFTPNIELIREPHSHGLPIQIANDIAQGVRNWSLRISGKVPKEGFSYLLLSLFGKVTTTLVTGYYQHYFNPGLSTPASLKLAIQKPIQGGTQHEWRLRGAMLKSLELIYETNAPVKFNAEFVGGAWETATSLSTITIPVPATGTNPFWMFGDSSFSLHSKLNLLIENVLAEDLEDSYTINSTDRLRLERAASETCFKLRLNFEKLFVDTTNMDSFKNFTAVMPFFELGSASIYYCAFQFNAKLVEHKLTPKGLGLIKETFTQEAINNAITDVKFYYYDKQIEPGTQGS
jgi:hypothetical protein